MHLDLEGRLHRAWLDGESYQRGFDGRVRRVRVGRGADAPRWLGIDVLDPPRCAGCRTCDRGWAAPGLRRGASCRRIGEPLERARLGPRALPRELEHFRRVYQPIPILPPDQNRALVVQITEGCSYNRCTFCHLYRDVRFRMRPPDELRRHVQAVRELVGRALPLRHGVFLGQANALVVEQQKLVEAIGVVRAGLGEGRSERSSTRSRDPRGGRAAQLHELGLESVALGLESGSRRCWPGSASRWRSTRRSS